MEMRFDCSSQTVTDLSLSLFLPFSFWYENYRVSGKEKSEKKEGNLIFRNSLWIFDGHFFAFSLRTKSKRKESKFKEKLSFSCLSIPQSSLIIHFWKSKKWKWSSLFDSFAKEIKKGKLSCQERLSLAIFPSGVHPFQVGVHSKSATDA